MSAMDDPSSRRRRSLWHEYRFEILWLFVVLTGIFLLVERMNIRATLGAWIRAAFRVFHMSLQQVTHEVANWIAGTTISDFIGMAFILLAAAGMTLRLRWRILNSERLSTLTCPVCGSPLSRIHRRPRDRLLSWFVPVRRYRCKNRGCGWSGLRVGTTFAQLRKDEGSTEGET
jgi:predicted RNA-binding Zn-ribbon protein involved in translation (DUF1610 family)